MVSISSSNPPQKTVTSIASTTNVTKALTFKKETMAKRIAHPLPVFSSRHLFLTDVLSELLERIIPSSRPVIKDFLDKKAENIIKVSKICHLSRPASAAPNFTKKLRSY
jgi:hypothetical protein